MKSCNSKRCPTEFGLKLMKEPGERIVDNTLYKKIVGILMYLTDRRPEIMHVASLISRYIEHPKEMQLLATENFFASLFYSEGEKSDLIGFTDSDYC